MRALRSCADALVSALFLVVVESLLVSLVFHRELAGAWELRQALRVLPAIGWVTVAPLAIVGALGLFVSLGSLALARRAMASLRRSGVAHRDRSGEPERAWARDDEHGDRVDQRMRSDPRSGIPVARAL